MGRYEYGVDRERTPALGLELTIRPVATDDGHHRNVGPLTWEHWNRCATLVIIIRIEELLAGCRSPLPVLEMVPAIVSSRLATVAAIGLFTIAGLVSAHEHHTEDIPEGEVVSAEPLVSQ